MCWAVIAAILGPTIYLMERSSDLERKPSITFDREFDGRLNGVDLEIGFYRFAEPKDSDSGYLFARIEIDPALIEETVRVPCIVPQYKGTSFDNPTIYTNDLTSYFVPANDYMAANETHKQYPVVWTIPKALYQVDGGDHFVRNFTVEISKNQFCPE